MKPKATTLSSRFGFMDPDLTSPEHDKIILDLLDESTMLNVLLKTVFKETKCKIYRHYPFGKRDYSWEPLKCKLFSDSVDCEQLQKENKCPKIKEITHQKTVFEKLTIKDILTEQPLKIETEYVIKNEYNNFIVGFVDLKVTIDTVIRQGDFMSIEFDGREVYIEIKTKITSFGETMRQLNMYREFKRKGSFLLITKTKGLTKAFNSQGVHVYEWN